LLIPFLIAGPLLPEKNGIRKTPIPHFALIFEE